MTQVKSRNRLRFQRDSKDSECSSSQDYSAPAISPILKGRDRLLSASTKKRNGMAMMQKSYLTELNSDLKIDNDEFRLSRTNANHYRSQQKAQKNLEWNSAIDDNEGPDLYTKLKKLQKIKESKLGHRLSQNYLTFKHKKQISNQLLSPGDRSKISFNRNSIRAMHQSQRSRR